MFDSVVQQLTGGDIGNLAESELHSHLDTLMGSASSDHVTGAVGDSLNALGPNGFAQSVQNAAQNQGPAERGQIGSLLMNAIQSGGGNPSSVLSDLGIGASQPQNMNHSDLGALAGYVAQNHGGALAGLLGGAGGSGGGMGGMALHLLGTPMVQQTALNLAKRFL